MKEDRLINYLLENLEGIFRNRQPNYNTIILSTTIRKYMKIGVKNVRCNLCEP